MRMRLKVLPAVLAGALLFACTTLRPVADAEAANRRASALAEAGDLAGAIGIWEGLAPSADGPQTAHLLRNLGAAYLLAGDDARAVEVLQRACLLDPLSARAWQQLGLALQRRGEAQRAAAMLQQAASLRAHDGRADVAAAGSAVAPIAQAAQAPAPVAQEWAAVLDLRGPVPTPETLRVEIRNGNGVRGMAASMARAMQGDQVEVVKLSNQRGFGVLVTRVEYPSAQEAQARSLARRVGAGALLEVDQVPAAQLRLVLGRDLVRTRTGDQARAGQGNHSKVTLPRPRAEDARLAGLP